MTAAAPVDGGDNRVVSAMTLVLLRHGESTWNLANRFTGWHDVPLTERGEQEAREAARLLREARINPDVVHTSVLLRAIQTANITLEAMDRAWLPVRRSWRLNERHYGDLEGLNKRETTERFGDEQVLLWRRSYATPPPPLDPGDERHPWHDPRYSDLPPEVLPGAESLKDVHARMLPYWQDAIVPDLRAGRLVLVAAHGNSLRALAMHLQGMTEDEVVALNLPTGTPRVYELDADLRPTAWRELGDPETLRAKADAVARQASAG
jgi:2,3-bisphosphoglycerate-dependent phosphoglycerate mutase